MTTAILGAGILGTCAALEIADRGGDVVLVDRREAPLCEASRANEGKIHLGLTYAADPTLRTVRTMMHGAARFFDVLERWVPAATLEGLRSLPFDYVVLAESQVPPERVERHFAAVETAWRAAARTAKRTPIAPDRPLWRRCDEGDLAARYAPLHVRAAFETGEIAIDPRRLAPPLRAAVAGHPRIRWLGETRITGIEAVRGGHRIAVDGPGGSGWIGPFPAVVNALWANRPWLDLQLGIRQPAPWLTRFKAGVFVAGPPPRGLRSVTAVLGPYGDVVVYSDGCSYLSWYPHCMVGTSSAPEPIDWRERAAALDRRAIARRTMEALALLHPAAAPLLKRPDADIEVVGGAIYALAATDIDDPASRLHRRDAVGIRSVDGYHSVDTGKFTLGPAMAIDVADRVRAA